MNENVWKYFSMLIALTVVLAACQPLSKQKIALNEARANAEDRDYYIPSNDVEGRNYDWRLRISDDPSLLVWCTIFPPTPGVKPFTVPITGKLTSGGKRPSPIEDTFEDENPDAQGMYGSSGEYRYGFGPTGMYEYYDSYQLPTFCTTMPLLWQTELTIIVQEKDDILMEASRLAHDAMEQGDVDQAAQILNDAIKKAQDR